MADVQDTAVPEGLHPGRVVAASLKVIAGLLGLATLIAVIARIGELAATGTATVAVCVQTAALAVVGVSLALLLWAFAEMLATLDEMRHLLRNSGLGSAPNTPPGPASRSRANDPRTEAQTHLLEELVHLMREVRDIELLSEPERAARLRVEASDMVQQLEADVPTLLREHNLQEAHQRLRRARQRFPSLPNWSALAQQIDQARTKFEEHDLQTATREIDDLAALGAWDRAQEVVRTLLQRHPESEAARELARRVALGRERATAEERARLMSQAQDATHRRDWPRALELVETLISHFPGSAEAQELRQQLPTLQANLEIQKRQQMETLIRDLVRARRFVEALRTANELIERYPRSPQALALRDQLPRLRERAAQPLH